jgi:adenine-specific DNA-methyltransferase
MTHIPTLFGGTQLAVPDTEGIKYAGSKLKILPHLLDVVSELVDVQSVLDGFSGSTRVSQAFAKLGFDTTASDVAVWSEVFATAYLLNTRPVKHYKPIIDHLNGLVGFEGWFTEHYGGEKNDPQKRPFQTKNTKKLDAIRAEIDCMGLDKVERAVALTSLIFALDSVDSTLGHYAAYLADWSPRSYNDLRLRVPNLFIPNGNNQVIRADIFDTVADQTFDLAYFDPPYGSNNEKMPPSRVRYNSYYHIWTSVILNDQPALFGKANRREDSRDQVAVSIFEEFRRDENGHFIAMQAIRRLVQNTQARYVLLSYSSGGRATKEELYDILNTGGQLIRAIEIDYKKNVMANMRWTNQWVADEDTSHREYLFLMKKN